MPSLLTPDAFANPVWAALTTLQARFAEGSRCARRFIPAITTLAAVEDESPESFQDLADLLQPGEASGVLLQNEDAELRGLEMTMKLRATMMVQRAAADFTVNDFALRALTADHRPQMLALTELTKPGPFGPRTHELGNYFGIFDGERLAAMAGERLHFPGYTEISAVCTHPDYAGRGYAAALVTDAAQRIRDRDETPFLHVREDNERAIKVYERLGFTTEKIRTIAVVRRAGSGAA